MCILLVILSLSLSLTHTHTHIIACSTNSRYCRETFGLLVCGLPVAMFNNIAVYGKARHKNQLNQLINTATAAVTAANNNNNKPDIIICDNEKGTCMLIDVAISGD